MASRQALRHHLLALQLFWRLIQNGVDLEEVRVSGSSVIFAWVLQQYLVP